nr:hypothetical protein [Tanacetum cinerariifolium]
MMIRKDPSLDQTGGLKDKKKEVSMHQLALYLKRKPRVQADLPQDKGTPTPVFEIGADDQPIVQTSQHPKWFSQPRRPPSPDRAWNTTLPAAQGDAQSWISDLARQADARSSFNELLDTPIDFSNFIMHRLNIYKFKEGDFKRLRLQDIEDMLLLLVQGKLSNLTVEERLAFNVSLRMFTRSIVIKRRVEDLQLGVESYQKKLNLTKPNTYRPDLRRREAYTAHSNPRGFI